YSAGAGDPRPGISRDLVRAAVLSGNDVDHRRRERRSRVVGPHRRLRRRFRGRLDPWPHAPPESPGGVPAPPPRAPDRLTLPPPRVDLRRVTASWGRSSNLPVSKSRAVEKRSTSAPRKRGG